MIRLVFSVFLLVMFIGGCSAKKPSYITENKIYSVALQNTQKNDVLYKSEVKAILSATYLNNVEDKYNDENHNFLVGVFIVDKKANETLFANSEYSLYMECDEVTSYKKLDHNELLASYIPLKNHWAEYYIISIKKEKQKTIMITLESKKYKDASVELPVNY
ncbi:hypothetical protein [Arcobacter sp. FWKO B]|uniref:hypothetical protein n=1 Tax=Arcobacter sp. FWKO B TaxID=2593672 RepID=UPI0018A585E8|nr:hypothetical protein [Arcobacter sp. FWKO B]QOG11174.1 hypothetical protein FWKOB_00065 [Arcobacter sp. FWKO B]